MHDLTYVSVLLVSREYNISIFPETKRKKKEKFLSLLCFTLTEMKTWYSFAEWYWNNVMSSFIGQDQKGEKFVRSNFWSVLAYS